VFKSKMLLLLFPKIAIKIISSPQDICMSHNRNCEPSHYHAIQRRYHQIASDAINKQNDVVKASDTFFYLTNSSGKEQRKFDKKHQQQSHTFNYNNLKVLFSMWEWEREWKIVIKNPLHEIIKRYPPITKRLSFLPSSPIHHIIALNTFFVCVNAH
jgi:hypothetical protein